MDGPTSFTPVTQETFAKWCEGYLEKLRKLKEERKTEKDFKQSGKQLFEQKLNKGVDITQFEVEEDTEDFKDEGSGSQVVEEEVEEQQTMYDRALFAAEEGIDDEVDFE